jgi:hypothetical protein
LDHETDVSEKEIERRRYAQVESDGGCVMKKKFRIPNSEFRIAKRWILPLILLFSQNISAQHTLTMYSDTPLPQDTLMCYPNSHATVKPYLDMDVYSTFHAVETDGEKSSAHVFSPRLTFRNYYTKGGFDYIHTDGDEKKIGLLIRPVYDFQGGQELKGNRAMYNAIGGIIIDADYKQKFGIEARFVSGITALNNAQDSLARTFGFLAGWGDRAYSSTNTVYAFQHFSGNAIWRPSKVFNLQVGRDKHFWGDGHRSLFLSDISAAFPYVKQQTTIWKLQYSSVFAWLQDWSQYNGAASSIRKKYASFHYISFNAAKWLNIGVFESVIWQGEDQSRNRGFDPNYLNPIVFFRPVEYSLGSSDNAMLGFAFKIRFNKNNQLYSQLILDEFFLKEIKDWTRGWWANKQGVQIGYKCFNFGTVKNLFMQTELNIVRPYTYTHGSAQQNYSHAGMPLAHPTGANFAEMIGILSYNLKGMTLTGKLVGIRYGMDPAGKNYGQNIFMSYLTRSFSADAANRDYGHKLFDGVGTNIFYAEFKAAYRFRTAFPIRVELTAGARSQKSSLINQKSSFVIAGLSLPLWRNYRDY